MSASCSGCCPESHQSTIRYRRILWIALVINFAMFMVELMAGRDAHSASLLADAVDFLGDAANYGISLLVLSMATIWRSRAALAKGLTMGLYGAFVLGQAGWNAMNGVVPEVATMGIVGSLALIANVSVAIMLFAFREGDANMRSVWLCSRNDAIGNVAVMLAALGVFSTGTAWPDLAMASVMGMLGLTAGLTVVRQSRRELAMADAPVCSASRTVGAA